MSSASRPSFPDPAEMIGHPLTRRGFLTAAGLALGACSATFLAACGSGGGKGSTSEADIDLAILRHALALELTAIAAYRAASRGLGGEERATARAFLVHEQEHADTLTKAIERRGGETAGRGAVRLEHPRSASPGRMLAFLSDLEEVLIAAYVEAAGRLSTSDLRATAGEIAADEAEHGAVLDAELGRPPAPQSFVRGDAGALSGAGLRSGALPSMPDRSHGSIDSADDPQILESAIAAEQAAELALRTGAAAGLLGTRLERTARLFAEQEARHIRALGRGLRRLGGTAPEPPRVAEVPGLGTLRGRRDFLVLAAALENAAIAAHGQTLRKLQSPPLLRMAASIASSEGRQLVVLRKELGAGPADSVPSAFEAGVSPPPGARE